MMISDTDKLSINTVFLALCIWREARGESIECQCAVAFSIMNRVDRPSWWGNDVMSVIFKKWQYSSMTAPKDIQLTTWPSMEDSVWPQCYDVAQGVLLKTKVNPVPGADSYFDISIPNPKWATDDKFVKQIGRIKFYNLDMDIEKL